MLPCWATATSASRCLSLRRRRRRASRSMVACPKVIVVFDNGTSVYRSSVLGCKRRDRWRRPMKGRWVLATVPFALMVAAVAGSAASAGSYPERPVMIVTPTGAGTGPDVITRVIADRFSREWGRQVVVLNRPGGGGLVAVQAMSTAERDGYTLFLPLSSTFVVLAQ